MNTIRTETTASRRAAIAGLGGGVGLAFGGRALSAAAQDMATEGHALVGTWFLDESSSNPTTARDVFIMHSDGTYVEANAVGTVRLGVWTPTSPTTATLTIVGDTRGEDGADSGGETVRLTITLNPDGNSYTAEGTVELRAPDGAFSGQLGPVGGAASRMMVEAPGTPAMTPAEFFGGAAGEAEATPAT